jgi:protocatechuate 3,4-dioxygenase beta subunit
MPSVRLPFRRRLLRHLGAVMLLLAAPARAQAASTLDPTPRDAEGPFYPRRFPADIDADLTRVAGRSTPAAGTPLYLSGRVLSTDGRGLAGVRVELWQCDALGRYHHVDGDPGSRDESFQGYGVAVTDGEGRYAFKTIRPVPYGGRPPHLHFKLSQAAVQPLTTQLYPRGESSERGAGIGLSGRDARARLEFTMAAAADREPGALASVYDFVLRSR